MLLGKLGVTAGGGALCITLAVIWGPPALLLTSTLSLTKDCTKPKPHRGSCHEVPIEFWALGVRAGCGSSIVMLPVMPVSVEKAGSGV